MIKEFNSLKGLLALMIFFHHIPIDYYGKSSLGIVAVMLFFMMSGFLSTIAYYDRLSLGTFNYSQYLINKAIKFYPIHWLFLIIAICLKLPDQVNWIRQIPVLGLNFFLLQSLVPIKNIYFSYNMVTWFLSDTLIFVSLFPLLLRGIVKGGKRVLFCAVLFVISLYTLIWIYLPESYTHAVFYISPFIRIVDFIVGILCALFFMHIKLNAKIIRAVGENSTFWQLVSIFLLLSLLLLTAINENFSYHSLAYLPIAFFLLILVGLNRGASLLNGKLLQKMGTISFAFFMSHQIVIRILLKFMSVGSYEEKIAFILCALILSIIVSYLVTTYFDNIIKSWIKKRKVQQSTIVR